jgi:prepilin-type N-terminal cleavage/methylation domain-containing protein
MSATPWQAGVAREADTASAAAARPGFSLVELLVAVAILGGALLSLAAFTLKFARSNSSARVALEAYELAAGRIEQVKSSPRYEVLDSLFEKTEPAVPGFPGFQRKTTVTRVGGTPVDSVDYQAVTVTVSHASLRKPVARTVFIAAF